jgi:hypothetical protein
MLGGSWRPGPPTPTPRACAHPARQDLQNREAGILRGRPHPALPGGVGISFGRRARSVAASGSCGRLAWQTSRQAPAPARVWGGRQRRGAAARGPTAPRVWRTTRRFGSHPTSAPRRREARPAVAPAAAWRHSGRFAGLRAVGRRGQQRMAPHPRQAGARATRGHARTHHHHPAARTHTGRSHAGLTCCARAACPVQQISRLDGVTHAVVGPALQARPGTRGGPVKEQTGVEGTGCCQAAGLAAARCKPADGQLEAHAALALSWGGGWFVGRRLAA